MAVPLWRLVCQTKSDRIQAVAQELFKISLFYIYMNRYLHIKVISFVPNVDLTFIIGHMSDNILYYKLLPPISDININIIQIFVRIGFWVANILIQFFVFVSALLCMYSSIETASLCKILEQSDHYSWRYCISKNWGIQKCHHKRSLATLGVNLVIDKCFYLASAKFRYFTSVYNLKAIGIWTITY